MKNILNFLLFGMFDKVNFDYKNVSTSYLNLEIDIERLVWVHQVFPELFIQIFWYTHVLEHSLEFAVELK